MFKTTIVPSNLTLTKIPTGMKISVATEGGKSDLELEISDGLWDKLKGDAQWFAHNVGSNAQQKLGIK